MIIMLLASWHTQKGRKHFVGPKQKGKPDYEGHLNGRMVSVASVLRKVSMKQRRAAGWS